MVALSHANVFEKLCSPGWRQTTEKAHSPLTVHLVQYLVNVCFQFARLQVARSLPEK